MTVSSTTSRVTYAGDGVSVAFPVSFYFLANADLVVLLVDSDDVSTTQVLTTNYTVTGAGVLAGGTVTMLVAPPSGYTLVIYRDPAVTQLVDYQPNDPFPADTHERALDKLTMIALRLKELVTRSMRLADSDTSGADTTLPTPEPLKVLGWNNAGDALVNTDASTLASVVAAGNPIYEYFNGDGVTVAFIVSSATLGTLPATKAYISGVRQSPGTDYTISGATVTFTTAPPAGTANILVEWTDAIAAVGVPSDGSITLGKLQDGIFTVTSAALLKFADGFFSATAGARAKFADGFVTLAKLATTIFNGATTVTMASGDKIVIADVSDSGNTKVALASDITAIISSADTTTQGKVELATNAEAAAGTDTARAITPAALFGGLNASGTAPIFACRAWINFNGTGTPAIRGSGNVPSITDNGVGDYTINFTTALPNANYAVVGMTTPSSIGAGASTNIELFTAALGGTDPTTSACRIYVHRSGVGAVDQTHVLLMFIG